MLLASQIGVSVRRDMNFLQDPLNNLPWRKPMEQIKVYRFKVLDAENSHDVVAPAMATREAIERGGGTIIESSETLVDKAMVDAQGCCQYE